MDHETDRKNGKPDRTLFGWCLVVLWFRKLKKDRTFFKICFDRFSVSQPKKDRTDSLQTLESRVTDDLIIKHLAEFNAQFKYEKKYGYFSVSATEKRPSIREKNVIRFVVFAVPFMPERTCPFRGPRTCYKSYFGSYY